MELSSSNPNLEPPRFETRDAFLLAGLIEQYNVHHVDGIPAQWQRFVPFFGKIAGQVGFTTYGVCFNMDGTGNMDYLCGVEVSDIAAATVPPQLSQLRLADQQYAVFVHSGHISKIRETWHAIFAQWAKSSGYTLATAPQFEAYGPEFNLQTGMGNVEIWIPLQPKLRNQEILTD